MISHLEGPKLDDVCYFNMGEFLFNELEGQARAMIVFFQLPLMSGEKAKGNVRLVIVLLRDVLVPGPTFL